MNSNLEYAINILQENNYTCVLYDGVETLTSEARGVKPLLLWLESQKDFSGFTAADKVIGKGAAFLYVLLGIKNIHALVISECAKQVLEENGINITYNTLVARIMNRDKTGFCPIETVVQDIEDATEALPVIKKRLEEIKKGV